MPKISIILPTYNGEKYIQKSIESIINQNFTDWELIIVDDCSKDNTPFIVDEYAKKDPRIKVIHNKNNLKLPKSLNVGFENSVGDFLTWTSDDNYYYKNAFDIMINQLLNNKKIYMVKANYDLIDEHDKTLESVYCNKNCLSIVNNVGACFLYRREVYLNVGDYDCSLFGVEDYDYWLRIEKKFGEIYHISQTLYAYRIHNQSLSQTKEKFVRFQLSKLKQKHIEYILPNLNKTQLVKLCFELKEDNAVEPNILKTIYNLLPEFKGLNNKYKSNVKHYIFGAGFRGGLLLKELNDTVIGFIDNDINKIGKMYNGYPVLSLESLIDIDCNDFQIVVAVDVSHVYEIVQQLEKNCIYNYYVI